jgi:uncharacterized membrane protein YkvA (DUF1232 family)
MGAHRVPHEESGVIMSSKDGSWFEEILKSAQEAWGEAANRVIGIWNISSANLEQVWGSSVKWIGETTGTAQDIMEQTYRAARRSADEAYEATATSIGKALEEATHAIELATEATTQAASDKVALATATMNRSILNAQEATADFCSGARTNLDAFTSKLQQYSKEFSADDFWGHLKKYAVALGLEGIKAALVLYYTLTAPDSEVPKRIKLLILAALGYAISPVDLIPDPIPVIGQIDDLAVLLLVLELIAKYIPDVAYPKAEAKLQELFGDDTIKQCTDREASRARAKWAINPNLGSTILKRLSGK